MFRTVTKVAKFTTYATETLGVGPADALMPIAMTGTPHGFRPSLASIRPSPTDHLLCMKPKPEQQQRGERRQPRTRRSRAAYQQQMSLEETRGLRCCGGRSHGVSTELGTRLFGFSPWSEADGGGEGGGS